jgi:hypothetical protein
VIVTFPFVSICLLTLSVDLLLQLFYLALWMANNIAVTLMNKAIFANIDFKYPYALSTVHMVSGV